MTAVADVAVEMMRCHLWSPIARQGNRFAQNHDKRKRGQRL